MNSRNYACLLGLTVTVAAATAGAADAPRAAAKLPNDDLQEVVVTGTLIRGVAPGGSSVITLSKEQIEAKGATNTDELLTALPQVTNYFNQIPFAGQGARGGNARIALNRPNLRNLPGGNTSNGPQTLIMLDGHRIPGAGIGVLAVDPEIVPPSLLERVETITDGGSAVYGSDALGGVINFITRRKFDGIETSAHYGFADSYKTYDASVTAGTSWSGGSAFISYSYAHHDPLLAKDRSYRKTIDWTTGLPTGTNCAVPNVTGATVGTYTAQLQPSGVPTFVAGRTTCDLSLYGEIAPEQSRHNAFVGLDQQLTDRLRLDIRGFYSHRHDSNIIGPLQPTSITLPATNFYYRPLPGAPAGQAQTVNFNYGAVLGNDSEKNLTTIESWGITPTLTWEITAAWQLRAMGTYGKSSTSFENNQVNTTLEAAALAGTTAATAINPYNIAATSNLALINDIASYINAGEGHNAFTNLRAIADGTVVALSGGELHAAFGIEYARNQYSQRQPDTTTRTFGPLLSYSQDVKSAFAEVAVPIVGAGNARVGIHTLTFSASVRHDDYNDAGKTTNPKLGLTYEPVDWVTLRANWGKSFNAPTAPDFLLTQDALLRRFPAVACTTTSTTGLLVPPGFVQPACGGGVTRNISLLASSGDEAGLRPQTARTWSFGFNVRPPLVPGLAVDISYYSIDLHDRIDTPLNSFAGLATFFTGYPQYSRLYPAITPADISAFFALSPTTGPALAASVAANGERVVSILDIRSRNLGDSKLAGVDFAISYAHETAFGSIDANLAGNRQLKQDNQIAPQPVVDGLAVDTPVWRATLTVGATIHQQLRVQATVNHTPGFKLSPSATRLASQTEAASFDAINTFVRYQFKGPGLAGGRSVSLGIDNLLDRAPPVLRDSASNGTTSGSFTGAVSTLGRVVQLGFSQKF